LYFDADVQVIKDLSPLLNNRSFIGYETQGDLEAAIIGAEAGTHWIGKCLEYYKGRHFVKNDNALDIVPLPVIINNVLQSAVENPELKIYPSDYFSPKSFHTGKFKVTRNTYCIHHFDSSWTNKNNMFYIKMAIHKTIILLFGQKAHNKIIQKIRRIL
jgi:mannosyltransferase OCH1-like enzyme